MIDFAALLTELGRYEVAFIVVGGAAIAYGSARLTQHLDIVYFTLVTSRGDIDLLGEILAGGGYQDLRPQAFELHIFQTNRLSLNQLIRSKRATGRPKDLDALSELEAIREEQGRS